MLELSDDTQKKVRKFISEYPFEGVDIKTCLTPEDISRKVAERLASAIELISTPDIIDAGMQERHDIGARETTVHGIKDNEPSGLHDLTLAFGADSTSIEDHVKNGSLGVGMRINRSPTNPLLFQKLKTNGVEPGFICKKDWSYEDTRGLMYDIDSEKSLAALEKLKKQCPDIAEKCANLPLREQIMLFGRAHPAGMAAVAEYMLEKGMNDANSSIYRAFCNKFPYIQPEQWEEAGMSNIKKALFSEIRDAVLNVKQGPDYEKSPIFKQFNDRYIVKLDYNENSRIIVKKAGSAGNFMRPKRTAAGRKAGKLYRMVTSTTADKSSADAVTEALANDLTRLAGVPSQELAIVRGRYTDNHPKLMLQAKFAEGYSDMGNGYIKDGRVVTPHGAEVESLGKYKAFFLVLADRDAIGRLGQNKGFSNGKFFAIDPGHSLEGNGKDLEIYDNLSFKDTHGFALTSRFANYSVFDDDTRFAKFQGVLNLRMLKNSGKFAKLFHDYRVAFNPNSKGISPSEKEMRRKIITEINKKEAEFNENLNKVLTAAGSQLALFDALAEDGHEMQEKAIELIENLEKLTSPTTWSSKNGEVQLKHLEVIPETRIPWNGAVEGENIVFRSANPLSDLARERLAAFANAAGAALNFDQDGHATLSMARAGAGQAMDVFAEENIARSTHPEEAAARYA